MLQVQKNNDIVCSGFRLSKTGLEVVGVPSFRDWENVGKFISRSSEAVQFWRGDWLNFGENTYDQWTQYFGKDVAAYGTLRNEKWVASRIPPSRRNDRLSWSHHYEVADLEPEEQTELLGMAERNQMSVSTFRKAVRHYKLKIEVPELSEEELQKTDPKVFESVQKIIDASITTIELLEDLPMASVHKDARDYLLSHLKRAATYYLTLVEKTEKEKKAKPTHEQEPVSG